MNRSLFLQMMAFFRLPAADVARLLHAGEVQQLKWRAVNHNVARRRRSQNTVVGYAPQAQS